jgi:hypothetical protein
MRSTGAQLGGAILAPGRDMMIYILIGLLCVSPAYAALPAPAPVPPYDLQGTHQEMIKARWRQLDREIQRLIDDLKGVVREMGARQLEHALRSNVAKVRLLMELGLLTPSCPLR